MSGVNAKRPVDEQARAAGNRMKDMTGKALKRRLHRLGISQAQLSRLVEVSPVTVNRWCLEETRPDGQPPPKYVEMILLLLGELTEKDRAEFLEKHAAIR